MPNTPCTVGMGVIEYAAVNTNDEKKEQLTVLDKKILEEKKPEFCGINIVTKNPEEAAEQNLNGYVMSLNAERVLEYLKRNQDKDLTAKAEVAKAKIDERLLSAYGRIRSKVRNGLAVVTVKRDACSGCFNRIPPQRQADIRLGKKLIVCEYCGRILVPGEEA